MVLVTIKTNIIMKKLFALLAIVVLLAPSCQKIEDRIDSLENRIEEIETTQIASLLQQINAINATLPELKQMDTELKGYITDLQTTTMALEEKIAEANDDIEELESALDKAINDAEASDDALKEDLISQLNTAKADVLAQLQSAKSALEVELTQINTTIATLQTKDTELEQKISTLEEYVNSELQNTEDWVSATFATLEQYSELSKEIAVIKKNIESLNNSLTDLEESLTAKIEGDIATVVATFNTTIQNKVNEITEAYTSAISTATNEITSAYKEAIATSITNLESSMKEWVNEQLTGYYTIAEINAALEILENALSSTEENFQSDIDTLYERIQTLKEDITAAYTNAITDAITNNNGVIDTKIATKIAEVNNRIDSEIAIINSKILAIESRLSNIERDITDLLSRIQSINYIPTHSDGKATLYYYTGRIKLDFEISPKEALPKLSEIWQSAVTIKAILTKTRAVEFIYLPIESFEVDQSNGIVSLSVIGDSLIPYSLYDNIGVSVAMSISDGNNSVASEYIPVIYEYLTDDEEDSIDPSYATLDIVECYARASQGGKQWDISFYHWDDNYYSKLCTEISLYNDISNPKRPESGLYTTSNGGVRPNSVYCQNTTNPQDIASAILDVSVDTKSRTITIVGMFRTENTIVTVNYTGEIDGMDLTDSVIADSYTKWGSVIKSFVSKDELLFTAISADSTLEVMFDIHHSGNSHIVPEGSYEVLEFSSERNNYVLADSEISFIGVRARLALGTVIVEHISGGYKFTFDVMDDLGRNFKGVIEGPISGTTNPA